MNRAERRRVWVLCCWLISAMIHFFVTAVVAVTLRPAGQGESAASTLIVSMAAADPVEMELATFTSPSDEAALSDAELLKIDGAQREVELSAELNVSEPDLAAPLGRPDPVAIADVAIPVANLASPNRREEEPEEELPPAAKAEFFGTVAHGDRFVYILDRSGSMEGGFDKNHHSRFDRARDELLRSVDELTERQEFCVVLFSSGTRFMSKGRYLQATEKNKTRLRDWLHPIKPSGGTEPNEALEHALAMKPCAVFLLSDGQFNVTLPATVGLLFRKASNDRHEIIDRINTSRVPVHTIAFEDASGAKNMQELSEGTGGFYRFVEASPEVAAQTAGGSGAAAATPVSPLPKVPTNEEIAAKLLKLGVGHEQLGHTDQAQDCYRRVIKQYPATLAATAASDRAGKLARP